MATLLLTGIAKMGLGGALAAGGTILSTVGAIQQGNAANRAAQYNAAQLEAAGKAENASAQRKAAEETRQKEFALSRARTVAAASGGGQDIPLMGQIEEEGTMRSLTALWEGEEAAKGRNAQAAVARFEGAQAKTAGQIKGVATLAQGASSIIDNWPRQSMYEKYWVPAGK